MKKLGLCLSRDLRVKNPLSYMGSKLPTYLRLLDLMKSEGWDVYVLTRKTYLGNGMFEGAWRYDNGKLSVVREKMFINLIYDRTGGVIFPPDNDELVVVNPRNFKIFCWDKWAAYQELREYMPKTVLVENEQQIPALLKQIKTETVVLKPYNGLKGIGVFIGSHEDALKYKFPEKYQTYIMQEFVDTSEGLPGIAPGMHDLRVALVGGVVKWCHVRIPPEGKFTANAAQGGSLSEISYDKVPESVKDVVNKISSKFTEMFGKSIIYSIDFGLDKGGVPKVFEINDQIGFPKWEMKNRDKFLRGLVSVFQQRLQK